MNPLTPAQTSRNMWDKKDLKFIPVSTFCIKLNFITNPQKRYLWFRQKFQNFRCREVRDFTDSHNFLTEMHSCSYYLIKITAETG
jgi:hypothetical protein